MLLALSIAGLFVLPEPWNVLGFVAAAFIEVGEVWLWMKFLERYRVRGGAEGMIGERAEILEACAPDGRVKLRGEIWAATAAAGHAFAAGERVRVEAVEGLRLLVGPLER